MPRDTVRCRAGTSQANWDNIITGTGNNAVEADHINQQNLLNLTSNEAPELVAVVT